MSRGRELFTGDNTLKAGSDPAYDGHYAVADALKNSLIIPGMLLGLNGRQAE
jgi:hypothetical protein